MKKEPAPIRRQPTKEFLKYQFTLEEIRSKGYDLARLNSEHIAIENEKKAVTAGFKAKLDGKTAEIEVLANHINNGYEHRYIDCEVQFNIPDNGMKTIVRKDNGEVVKAEPMTDDEKQLELDLQ